MIKVTFGEHDRCDDKTRPETRFVLRAISQPFSFSNFDNDVALLRLNDRVPITEFIRPICLPTKKSMQSISFHLNRRVQCIAYNFFFFLRYFFATLGRINDWNSDYVCRYKGRCNGMGHLERGWQTIVHSTRSWSSNYGEQRLRWKHKLYTKNDHWQHALCWLSRRWQKRLVPSKPLFDCGLMWISNDAIIWISILGGLRWAAHRATWWQTVWTSGHRFMGWEHFEC